MSKVAIQGNASGTATFTVAAPVGTGVDRTLTLPDEAGTVVTTAGADFTGQVTTTSGMGVGTASPTDSTLHAKNSSSGSALKVESNTGNNYINFYDGATRTALVGTADGSTNNFYVSNEANTPMLFRTNGTERMRVDTTGVMMSRTQAGIDNSKGFYHRHSDGYTYIVRNTGNLCLDLLQSSTGDILRFNNSSIVSVGTISCTASSTSYNTSSDYRLKENVVDMTGAIDRVKALNPTQFNFIADPDTTVDGFLAHEVQTVVPEAVTGTHNEVDDDGNPVYQGIDQSKLVPLLTGALQEAIAKIETLETTVADLQTRVTALEATP